MIDGLLGSVGSWAASAIAANADKRTVADALGMYGRHIPLHNSLSNHELDMLHPILDRDKPENYDTDKWRKVQIQFLGNDGCRNLISRERPLKSRGFSSMDEKAFKEIDMNFQKALADSLLKGTDVQFGSKS